MNCRFSKKMQCAIFIMRFHRPQQFSQFSLEGNSKLALTSPQCLLFTVIKSPVRYYRCFNCSVFRLKILLVMLIKSIALALLVAIVACARPTRYFEEETEIAAYRDDDSDEDASNSEEYLRTFTKYISYQFELDQEVNELIGIHEEEMDETGHVKHPADLSNLKRVLENNKKWAKNKLKMDDDFFGKHVSSQKPKYLWIGCSDSRLPANQILGLDYGEVFVLRNVANMVSPSDISSLAVIQYAVEILQVKDIIVAGHYNCGGVKAAVTKYNHGPLEAWLSKLRRIRHKHAHAFQNLTTVEEKAKLLVEINVKQQVFNVASTPFVQQAWKIGQELRIHGLVFSLENGRLIDLNITMHTLEQLPEQLAVVE